MSRSVAARDTREEAEDHNRQKEEDEFIGIERHVGRRPRQVVRARFRVCPTPCSRRPAAPVITHHREWDVKLQPAQTIALASGLQSS